MASEPTVTRLLSIAAGIGQVVLRGKLWEFENVEWAPAEYDVGIMSAYPTGFDLMDADGNLWDWEKDKLTDEETGAVDAALSQLDQPEYEEYE